MNPCVVRPCSWSAEDEGPTATCPSDRTLLGCWCKSTSHRGDNCARVWADGNSCRARANGVRAHTSHVDIHVTANCATMKTSLMILSELKIELQQPASLAETPVVEARAIGHLAPLSFEYMHLHQQCDSLLLMGGIGVEHCSRPNYRKPNYHPWQQKKVLPMSFVHGSELKARSPLLADRFHLFAYRRGNECVPFRVKYPLQPS